jgi:glycosyltransferase involved in cell wall biosynthesis
MRFAFISTMHDWPWGGSEELWSQTALRLKNAGHQVYASVGYREQAPAPITKLREQGIRISMHSSRFTSLSRRIWNKASLFDRRCRTEIRKFRPDLVVISQGFNSGGFEWAKTCREFSIPYVIIVHCNSENWWFQDQLENADAAYRGAVTAYCVSNGNLKLLNLQLGEPLTNAAIVRNPYNVDQHHIVSWPKDDGVWRLACVARLDPAAKGHDLLFQIMDQPVWRQRPVELNLFGNGPDEPVLKKIISTRSLTNVHLRGHVPNIASIWDQSHILVLPSRYEGLPIALVEAMLCGRTAVITDVAGNTELLTDGKTAFVAQYPSLESFGAALEKAWQRRSEWRSMGLAARDEVQSQIPQDPIGVFCEELNLKAAQFGRTVTTEDIHGAHADRMS